MVIEDLCLDQRPPSSSSLAWPPSTGYAAAGLADIPVRLAATLAIGRGTSPSRIDQDWREWSGKLYLPFFSGFFSGSLPP